MDFTGVYKGGGHKKHINPKEIKKMIENMKKAPIIKLKGDNYQKKEQEVAEKLLSKINENLK